MKDLEVEFDKIFSKYGGALTLDDVDRPEENSIKTFYDIIEILNKTTPNLPIPYVSVVDSYEVNAIVTKVDKQYYIGLFRGAILMLAELFSRMLANPNILPNIGNTTSEVLNERISSAQFAYFEDFVNFADLQNPSVPKDPVRLELASYFLHTAVTYLLLHEYAHIVNGHIDFTRSKYQNNDFEEKLSNVTVNGALTENISSIMFRQTCEYDADNWAGNISLKLMKMMIENTQPKSFLMDVVYKDYKSAIYYYNFSIYSYWRIFGFKYEMNGDLLGGKHPPSGMRQHFNMAMIFTYLEQIGLQPNEISDQCLRSLVDVEAAFDSISEQGNNPKGILTTYSEEHLNHMNKIISNWKFVRELLVPFAYIKLAP
jgi:hypothetical protein